jgi:glycosyltransferase involved in cell wall biosynthesis
MEKQLLFWFPFFPLTSAWKTLGRLAAVTDVAMDKAYFEGFSITPGIARKFRKQFWDTNIETCDRILTLSKWAAESNRALYPQHAEKIKCVGWGPNIVPPLADEILHTRKEDRIICVGHNFYRKGMDIYNEVSRRLKARLPGLECIVIGNSHNTLAPSALDTLTVYSSMASSQVASMMKTSKLFVLFSRFDPSPHVIVEAMSHGLPVICSNVCGMAEPLVEGETGYSCGVHDIDYIVDKAYDLLTHNEKRQRFSCNAYHKAMKEWQQTHVAERIWRFLN